MHKYKDSELLHQSVFLINGDMYRREDKIEHNQKK